MCLTLEPAESTLDRPNVATTCRCMVQLDLFQVYTTHMFQADMFQVYMFQVYTVHNVSGRHVSGPRVRMCLAIAEHGNLLYRIVDQKPHTHVLSFSKAPISECVWHFPNVHSFISIDTSCISQPCYYLFVVNRPYIFISMLSLSQE